MGPAASPGLARAGSQRWSRHTGGHTARCSCLQAGLGRRQLAGKGCSTTCLVEEGADPARWRREGAEGVSCRTLSGPPSSQLSSSRDLGAERRAGPWQGASLRQAMSGKRVRHGATLCLGRTAQCSTMQQLCSTRHSGSMTQLLKALQWHHRGCLWAFGWACGG